VGVFRADGLRLDDLGFWWADGLRLDYYWACYGLCSVGPVGAWAKTGRLGPLGFSWATGHIVGLLDHWWAGMCMEAHLHPTPLIREVMGFCMGEGATHWSSLPHDDLVGGHAINFSWTNQAAMRGAIAFI